MTRFVCAYCGDACDRPSGEVNRARLTGAPLYCNKTCFGLAHRKGKTKAQKVAEKAAYDRAYRVKNLARIQASKRAYFQRTYDPAKAAVERKKNMARHVAYCQRPEYRAWKATYDRHYRAKKLYGAFDEVAMLTIDLNRAIKERMTNHEIKWENRTANKAQFRRREAGQKERSRPRSRDRRRDHQSPVGERA